MDKTSYLNEIGLDPKTSNTSRYFKKAEPIEEMLDKDLCEWSASEIIDFYKSICTPSIDHLKNIHSAFGKYTVWCQNKNLLTDNINHYEEITTDALMQCVNKGIADKRIINRNDLIDIIAGFKNARDQFICLALFEGLAGKELEEIRNVKLTDFDEKKQVVTVYSEGKERKIPYTKTLFRYAKAAAEQTVYDTEKETKRVYKLVGEPEQIVKKVVSNEKEDTLNVVTAPVVLYRNIKNIQKEINNPAFNSKALKESGRIDMIKRLRTANPQLSLDEAVKSTYNIYGRLTSILAYINKYNDFLK